MGAPRKDKCVSQIKGTSVISKKHLLPSISSRDVNNKEVYHLMGEVRGWWKSGLQRQLEIQILSIFSQYVDLVFRFEPSELKSRGRIFRQT